MHIIQRRDLLPHFSTKGGAVSIKNFNLLFAFNGPLFVLVCFIGVLRAGLIWRCVGTFCSLQNATPEIQSELILVDWAPVSHSN
jgi:hypothetical protein